MICEVLADLPYMVLALLTLAVTLHVLKQKKGEKALKRSVEVVSMSGESTSFVRVERILSLFIVVFFTVGLCV
jgi:hypothetical protein